MTTNNAANHSTNLTTGQTSAPETRTRSCAVRAGFFKAILAGVIVVAAAQPSWAQTRYSLTCRGGAGIQLGLYHNENMSIGANSINNNLVVSFRKAAGASWAGLWPGECAWSDRPLASSEPQYICISNVSAFIGFNVTPDGRYEAFTFTNNKSPANDVATRALNGLRRDTQYQTFWVYNDRQGCLRP